jgi:hypothetical protein
MEARLTESQGLPNNLNSSSTQSLPAFHLTNLRIFEYHQQWHTKDPQTLLLENPRSSDTLTGPGYSRADTLDT